MSADIFTEAKWKEIERVNSAGTFFWDKPPWHKIGQKRTAPWQSQPLRDWVNQLGEFRYDRQPNFTRIPLTNDAGQIEYRLAPTGRYSVQLQTAGGEFVGYVDTDVPQDFFVALPGDVAEVAEQALSTIKDISPATYEAIDLDIMGYLSKSSEIIVPPTSVDWLAYDLDDYVEYQERTAVANRFFATFKLQPLEIFGDTIGLYKVLMVPMDRSGSIRSALTRTRLQCANTWWMIEENGAIEQGFTLRHKDGVLSALKQGIIDMMLGADASRSKELARLTRFGSYRLVESDYSKLIQATFPKPSAPTYTPDATLKASREHKYELATTRWQDTVNYLAAAWHEPETYFVGGWDNLAARGLQQTGYHAFANLSAVATHARGAGDVVSANQAIAGGERTQAAQLASDHIAQYLTEHEHELELVPVPVR